MPSKPFDLLVVVHPGSIASYMHSGYAAEQSVPDGVVEDIYIALNHGIPIVLVEPDEDGVPSDELLRWEDTRVLGETVSALHGYADVLNADPWEDELAGAAMDILGNKKYKKAMNILLTGAWGGYDGCVTVVADVLADHGRNVMVSEFVPIG